MPKYEISGSFKIEIVAETRDHALELLYAKTMSKVSTEGTLDTDEPDYVAPDHEGERADAMRGARGL